MYSKEGEGWEMICQEVFPRNEVSRRLTPGDEMLKMCLVTERGWDRYSGGGVISQWSWVDLRRWSVVSDQWSMVIG
jgi:hypothetical protein